jgi:hypothetical protein
LGTHFLKPLLDHGNAVTQQATVGFQLGFTRATQANTAFLALKVRPAPYQTRRHMTQLRQFNLQFTFKGASALGKDIKNEPRPIQHTALQLFFQVALLTGGKGMVKNDEFGFVLSLPSAAIPATSRYR